MQDILSPARSGLPHNIIRKNVAKETRLSVVDAAPRLWTLAARVFEETDWPRV